MSSLPGLTLESYLAWNYDIVALETNHDPNVSLCIAEALGSVPLRPRVTQEHFKGLVAIVEPLREVIEQRLLDFDEENQSWRSYAGSAFDDFDEQFYEKGRDYLKGLGYIK